MVRMLRISMLSLVSTLVASCTPRAPVERDPSDAGSPPATSVAVSASASAAPAPQPSASLSATTSASANAPGPPLVALGFELTATHREPRLSWRQIDKMYWQASPDGLPALGPETAMDPKQCPAGMLLVDGGFLVDAKGNDANDEITFAQNAACSRWLTPDHGLNGVCDRFDRDRWLSISAKYPRKHLRFCIDRYEFPNVYGEFPLVVSTFAESEKSCSKVGKRLCSESEWTLACEGEEGLPFPYGYERDGTRCNIGILAAAPDSDTFKPRFLERTARGIDFAWHGKRSGESPRCVSPYGVQDITGNVDEWTRSVRSYGYKMIMKGGHWGPGRHRCRPQTRGHGPYYIRYDQGFRCCKDVNG